MRTKKQKNPWIEVVSILVVATGVFSLAALWTYHPTDPSYFTRSSAAVQNACGPVGAYMAAAVLQFFGMGGFLLPAALFFLGATVHQREGMGRFVGIFGGMLTAVLALTVFLSLQWKFVPYSGSLLLTGGVLGAWIADMLQGWLNPLGASIASLSVFCLALVLSTPVSVAKAVGWTLRVVSVTTWKATRWLAVVVGSWLGIGAVRLAHATGDGVHRLIQSGLNRARERREAVRSTLAARESEPEIQSAAPVEDDDGLMDDSVDFPDEAENESLDAPMPIQQKFDSVPKILPRESDSSHATQDSRPTRSLKSLRKGAWKLPTIEFLRKTPRIESRVDNNRLIENSRILVQKLADFGINGEVTSVAPGPVITLYEFRPGPGIKVSKIAALADDLSMALSAKSVRILAPLPGKSVVGIEVPNEARETVFLREFLQHGDFYGTKHSIPVAMGKDIAGLSFISDLGRMPHLLCAGQTGSGKSVFMNGLICSLLYRFTPDELRMILVDPKFIEFRGYQDIPHLLLPVVDDPNEAKTALKWAVREMERRYRILATVGARNLGSYNQKIEELGGDTVRDLLVSEQTGNDWVQAYETNEVGEPQVGKLPYIVVIIDELADLMMMAKKDVEVSIARIAQKARAAGIHLVIATQRPSTDVITGIIKANLPSRVSFQLASYIDSKTILDRAGAERLLGQGDMLFTTPGISEPVRLHGAYVDDEEIHKITSFLKSQGKPEYRDEILIDEEEEAQAADDDADELFDEAVDLVKRQGHASASFLQRHLKVGYNRAARMIETMEGRGIVGPADGARPREVLIR